MQQTIFVRVRISRFSSAGKPKYFHSGERIDDGTTTFLNVKISSILLYSNVGRKPKPFDPLIIYPLEFEAQWLRVYVCVRLSFAFWKERNEIVYRDERVSQQSNAKEDSIYTIYLLKW